MTPQLPAKLTLEQFQAALESAVQQEGPGELKNALIDAAQRLRDSPSLLRGSPDDEFTFSDPELSQALYGIRTYLSAKEDVRHAGSLPGQDLSSSAWGRWALTGLRLFFHRGDSSYKSLATRTPATAIGFDKPVVRLAIVGDAGYRGMAQNRVVQMILSCHRQTPFDAVIHLGDIYFAAGAHEILSNFLVPFSAIGNTGPKVYTLLGNHDLYYGAEAFEYALSILGQPGRYFGIETPDWRISCLDTSLFDDSMGRLEGRLDGGQLSWFEAFIADGHRANLVLSHHYYLSAWKPYGGGILRGQLAHLMKERVLAWYWGHEHICATYERGEHGFYGACIGNGAFREPWSEPPLFKAGFPSWYAEGRCVCYPDANRHDWPHGFLELELRPDCLIETYHLEDGPELRHERILRRPAKAN